MINIGIDWGTSKCCMSYIIKNKIFLMEDNNDHIISTVIAIINKNILVGNQINKGIIYNTPIISNLKRLIGYDIKNEDMTKIIKYYNWNIYFSDINNDIIISQENNDYILSELIMNIMSYLKNIIFKKFQNNFNSIITVPAHFNDYQRRYIIECANKVGLQCNNIINEPVSASLTYLNLYYNVNEFNRDGENVLVFDFGAGTLDLAIVNGSLDFKNNNLDGCKKWTIEVIGTIGNNNIGGIDIDYLLLNWFIENYNDIYLSLMSRNEKINKLIEDIKITLSNYDDEYQTEIFYIDNHCIIMSINDYHELLENNFGKIIENLLDDLLKNASLNIEDLLGILLVGGSSKNRWIKKKILSLGHKIINTDACIDIYINEKNKKLNFEDMSVSIGAAYLNYKDDNSTNLLLLDTVPLSLGVEEFGGKMSKIIKKDSLIPICVTKDYTLSDDYDDDIIDIKIYQGERELCINNFFIGNIVLNNLHANKNYLSYNKPRIQVTIDIDRNNIINIIAKEWRTSNENNLKITNNKIKLPTKLIENNINVFENFDNKENLIITNYYEIITYLNRIIYNIDENINLDDVDKIMHLIIKYINASYINFYNQTYLNFDELLKIICIVKNKYFKLFDKDFDINDTKKLENNRSLDDVLKISYSVIENIKNDFGNLLLFYNKEFNNNHLTIDNDNNLKNNILENALEKRNYSELIFLNGEDTNNNIKNNNIKNNLLMEKNINKLDLNERNEFIDLVEMLLNNIDEININTCKRDALIYFLTKIMIKYNDDKINDKLDDNIIINYINDVNTYCDSLEND